MLSGDMHPLALCVLCAGVQHLRQRCWQVLLMIMKCPGSHLLTNSNVIGIIQACFRIGHYMPVDPSSRSAQQGAPCTDHNLWHAMAFLSPEASKYASESYQQLPVTILTFHCCGAPIGVSVLP